MKSITVYLFLIVVFTLISCVPRENEEDANPNITYDYSIDNEAVKVFKNAMGYLSNLLVNRPDKLRAERHSELYNLIFFYDGSTFTQ